MERLKDTDPMPFGKYKGTPMVNVKASYLIWIYEKFDWGIMKPKGINGQRVRDYIIDNYDLLLKETEQKKAGYRKRT